MVLRIASGLRRTLVLHSTSKRRLTTSAADAADQLLRNFAGKTTTRRQILDGNQLQKLSLTLGRAHLHPGLDVSEDAPPPGTPLPPGYHLAYFTPVGTEAELGPDGTDRTFNAPAPFTRRMWAGGRMKWNADCQLRVGEAAEERTRLLSAVPKKSRDGNEMVLVDVEKQFWGEKGLALVDQR
jgi:hydroxyacyl-ACP dehydratase HTD2-like protein with hotdog domain